MTMHRRIHVLSLCLGLALLAMGLASCGPRLSDGQERVMNSTTFDKDKANYPAPDFIFKEYRLKPGDQLDVLFQIRTWELKEKFTLTVDDLVQVKFVDLPELNEEQNVTPNGYIYLPYIGGVLVAGRTVDDVTAEIRGKYKSVLRSPQIYVTVPEFSSHIRELKADLHTAPRGLSRLVTIRPDGIVTFPLVGDVMAAHKTIPELHKEVDKLYDSFLAGLHVDLFLEQSTGAVVYIMGAVNTPGSIEIRTPITVLDAVARAGGLENTARPSKVVIFRKPLPNRRVEEMPPAEQPKRLVLCCPGNDVEMPETRAVQPQEELPERTLVARGYDLENAMNGREGGEHFWLKPDDIVYIPRRETAKWAEIMREVANIFLFNGWGIGFGADLLDDPLFDLVPGKSEYYSQSPDGKTESNQNVINNQGL
ncbi:polysaccharide biosynthesis/export family protein [Megalodesulfovibrio paquesii]